MSSGDIATLRTIRGRRLDEASAARQRCDRELAAARARLQQAERDEEKARRAGKQRIEQMYDKLLAAGVCTVKDLDDVRFAEAQLRERLAQLAKAAKDAAAAAEQAAEKLEEARKHWAAMSAAVEAIDLLDEEQRAEQLVEETRAEDEAIDEVALLRRL